MKNLINILLLTTVLGCVLSSCVNDEPFADGEGVLKMRMYINNQLTTRAVDNEQTLAENCVIYLSNSKGLIYKFKGLDNVPSDIYLKSGSYVAEAWTGDSVTASFDKKFYKAYEPFNIAKGDVKNVVLNCKIANVVASINPEPILAEALRNYVVTIGNTRGSLEFTAENAASAHGYFMMPTGDTSLTWSIKGERENGEEFTKSGVIENVEPAHEYVLNIRYTPSSTAVGGAYITVEVDDTEVIINDEVKLKGAPVISGVGYDIENPISSASGKFEKKSVYIQAWGKLKNLNVSTSDFASFGLPSGEFDMVAASASALAELEMLGLTYETEYDDVLNISSTKVSFGETMLNKLTNGDYSIQIVAVDANDKEKVKTLYIKVSDAGVILQESDWTEIYAYRATLHALVVKENQVNPGFRYRASGDTEWINVIVNDVAVNTEISVEINNLKPGTRYEYQAVSDGFVNTESMYFTTESLFEIPNASFEDWSVASDDAIVPGLNGEVTFWDSGNHGSITMDVNITTGSSDIYNTGSKSARLGSKFVGLGVIGKFAAGNIFAGRYVETDGMDGILSFGRPFNGSRPVKLIGWANYRPGVVDKGGSAIANGVNDQGQIYVALTTQEYTIKTKSSERQLFNSNDASVLAYGELTWTDNFGEDGKMKKFEVVLDYKDAAKLTKATHLVLVASASKYGDYFEGSTSSTLYIDDLEFVYE